MEQNPYSESNYSSQIEIQPSIDPKLQAPYKKRYLSIDAFRGLVFGDTGFCKYSQCFPFDANMDSQHSKLGLNVCSIYLPRLSFLPLDCCII